MADDDVDTQWDDEDTLCSSHSDESPILSYRHDRRRFAPYVREISPEDKDRKSTFTVLAKFFLFSTAMILFCVLMYIPVYNKANDQLPKGLVTGWSVHTNRDTKIYVQPNNLTTIREPTDACPKENRDKKNKLFLLMIVCSSTAHFERRLAIRQTWGSYKNYLETSEVFFSVRDKYKNYNYSYDLYQNPLNVNVSRGKREISGFGQLLPELAKALKNNLEQNTVEKNEEKRFDDEDSVLPEFDMNKELEENYDYNDNESNVMKIPPKGYEENAPDLMKIFSYLKEDKLLKNLEDEKEEVDGNTDPDFKLVFLLGLPAHENDTELQNRIDDEANKYGDIIQEGFLDTYNNLTLKSIMMLKWVKNNCNESVRYILKTDDDMYINVPNLILNLRNKSREYDAKVAKGFKDKEYLLIGDLICGARPVLDSNSKWYSPRYMYGGKVYPRYLSGTGYVLTTHTVKALYAAALRTNYFHLEDIYITGMCAARSRPRITPRDDPLFSYMAVSNIKGSHTCAVYAHVTAHRITPHGMRALQTVLNETAVNDRCERLRLTQVRRERMKPKKQPKKIYNKVSNKN